MNILQVNTSDLGGGAERVAWMLAESYGKRGHQSYLAVGFKRSRASYVLQIPHNRLKRAWFRLGAKLLRTFNPSPNRIRIRQDVQRLAEKLPWPFEVWRYDLGFENFDFFRSQDLLALTPSRPDIIHCHNLHGPLVPNNGYFDLRQLTSLSKQLPVVLTLHDAWLLSGHCAHSFECERWKTGCGSCPDLSIYPAARRDSTAYNWRRKQAIFAQSQLYVATPSQWLMQKVEQSILAPAIVQKRVIPNGVDTSIFHIADKNEARIALGIPLEARVLLFAANSIRQNIWKDYEMVRTAVALLAEKMKEQPILFIALGEEGSSENIGQAEIRFVPFQRDAASVARYYQAADLYLHASKADTFPNTILEALACGTPVVATAVGGIPEQVNTLPFGAVERVNSSDTATGVLVLSGDAQGMAQASVLLLTDKNLLSGLGDNAAKDAHRRFSLERQVNDYLEWYQEIRASGNEPVVRKIAGG